jgi:arsenate reductase (thioredoxin)
MKVAFVCVQNAGRSQMAAAFAERECEARGVDAVDVLSGGTQPADSVHGEVVEAMREVGLDVGDRAPREITPEELGECEYVVTMGCSAEGVCPATWSGENRDWGLEDPHGKDPETVRAIRDEVERRVEALFDELTGPRRAEGSSPSNP